jgi:3-hydroxyisobutyrate dehydrogenase-like beta-hydroxyacid dehydrogenase
MGTAFTERLLQCGWPVTTWTRSGCTLAGATAAESPAAVAAAPLVLMCLFDAAACHSVLDRCAGALGNGTVLVNTSTVGPDDADELDARVRATGADYVHAPVIGSTGAAGTGAVRLLVGAAGDPRADVDDLLADLGTVHLLETPRTAAAAKLMANGALGGGLLTIGHVRRAAAEAGLDPTIALDVLAHSALGGLVGRMRPRLEGPGGDDAAFTVAALAKDLTLLAEAAPAAAVLHRRVAAALAADLVRPDDDVSALCGTRAPAPVAADARLELAPDVDRDAPALAPLVSYARGHATGDPAHFRRAFHPTAHVEGVRDGELVSWDLDAYCALFTGRPAADEAGRRRRIDRLDVTGTVAGATMTLHHGPDTFTDAFVLLRVDDEWRIANKVYDRR